MRTILRCRGRSDSAVLLWTSLILGFTPVAAYFSVPGTRWTAVGFGALLGLPFFLASLWRLLHMDALTLSDDARILSHFRRSPGGRTRLDIPVEEIEALILDTRSLVIQMKSGARMLVDVDGFAAADASLRPLAKTLNLSYSGRPMPYANESSDW